MSFCPPSWAYGMGRLPNGPQIVIEQTQEFDWLLLKQMHLIGYIQNECYKKIKIWKY
jgi:hypothetical protein